ncbi:MAG: hypothetical protein ACYCUI_16825 [Vulcanimicrobiaceae bacterium]
MIISGHQKKTSPLYQTMTTLVCVSSEDRSSGTPTSFSVQIPQLWRRFTKVKMRDYRIPNVIPNFSSTSDTFTLEIDSSGTITSTSYTVPTGYYTETSLLTAINSLLSATTISAVFDANSLGFEFSTTSTTITSFTLNFTGSNSCGPQLGFKNGQSYTSTSNILYSAQPLNLASPDLYVRVTSLPMPSFSSNGNIFSFYIPNNTTSGYEMMATTASKDQLIEMGQEMQVPFLQIELVDRSGKEANLSLDWSITLEFIS